MAHVYPFVQDSDNIQIGPCYAYYDKRHLGLTYGGVTISITQSAYEIKSDQYGDTPIRNIDGGLKIEVTVNMTESSFDNLKVLFSSYTDNTTYLTFGKPVGTVISGKELVLEPADGSSIYQIYNAVPNIGSAIELSYTTGNQRVYACKFVGQIDLTRVEGDQLFRIGGYSSS